MTLKGSYNYECRSSSLSIKSQIYSTTVKMYRNGFVGPTVLVIAVINLKYFLIMVL